MERNNRIIGHLLALLTIIIWGSTLVSTKMLLTHLNPMEIVLFRFIFGYFSLFIIYPKLSKPVFSVKFFKEETLYLLAGFFGVTVYMILQNIALDNSTSSNISLILSTSPFFTALLLLAFFKEKIGKFFIIGFLLSFFGVFIVVFNGSFSPTINVFGDVLAIITAFSWSIYCVLLKKISKPENNFMLETRKIFFYGLLTMIPIFMIFRVPVDFLILKTPVVFFHAAYLGVFASAVCFVTWSRASSLIGTTKTSAYIYLIPIISIIFAATFLHEKITFVSIVGCFLILLGLFVSEKNNCKDDSKIG